MSRRFAHADSLPSVHSLPTIDNVQLEHRNALPPINKPHGNKRKTESQIHMYNFQYNAKSGAQANHSFPKQLLLAKGMAKQASQFNPGSYSSTLKQYKAKYVSPYSQRAY